MFSLGSRGFALPSGAFSSFSELSLLRLKNM